jgi:hypothetical protein
VRAWAKMEAREAHVMLLGVWESENEHSHSQVSSRFGSWSPGGPLNFQRAITGVKTHWIEEFLISLKSSWNINV